MSVNIGLVEGEAVSFDAAADVDFFIVEAMTFPSA
jgi:hypothetical protein